MSPPIRDGSGSSIGSIRLGDGSEISEVRTGAGDVVFSGISIPDGENLQSRIDARELSLSSGDAVTSVTDSANSNNTVTVNGSPTYRSASNSTLSVPSIEFDGSDDSLEITFQSSIGAPYSVYWIGTVLDDSFQQVVWGPNPSVSLFGLSPDGSGGWQWRLNGSGDNSLGANTDTNGHVYGSALDANTGDLRKDGTFVGSADPDAGNGLDGIFYAQQDGGGNFSNIQLTEALVYSVDEDAAGNESDIESYLDRDTTLI